VSLTFLSRGYRLIKATRNWHDILLFELKLKKSVVAQFRSGARILYTPPLFNIEQFLDEPYKCLSVEGKDVVDIGAFNGDSAIYFSLKGAKRVYAFEPYPYAFNAAVQNIRLNNLRNIEIYNEALGGEVGQVILDEHYRSHSKSILRKVQVGRKVTVATLGTLVHRFNLKDAALKIDCEGCEHQAFSSSDTATLNAFSQIILEYHYQGYKDIAEKLKSAGFQTKFLDTRGSPVNQPKPRLGLLYAYKKPASPIGRL
jgi:FkbM family methyltransferase